MEARAVGSGRTFVEVQRAFKYPFAKPQAGVSSFPQQQQVQRGQNGQSKLNKIQQTVNSPQL